jgi:hypothetical protein
MGLVEKGLKEPRIMIETLCVLGYFLVGVLASRPIYGHLRKLSIAKQLRVYPSLYQYSRIDRYDVEYYGFNRAKWNREDRPPVILSAILISMLWPLVLTAPVGYVIYKYMTGSKIRSQVEIEAETEQLNKRIVELERELHIR